MQMQMQMTHKAQFWLVLAFALVNLMGCTAANHQHLLRKHVDRYNQQLRWSLMEDAQSFVADAYTEAWRKSHLRKNTQLKVVSIEPRLVKVTQVKPPSAFFKTKIVWYLESDMRVQESIWQQEWRFEQNRWRLLTEKKQNGDSAVWP